MENVENLITKTVKRLNEVDEGVRELKIHVLSKTDILMNRIITILFLVLSSVGILAFQLLD